MLAFLAGACAPPDEGTPSAGDAYVPAEAEPSLAGCWFERLHDAVDPGAPDSTCHGLVGPGDRWQSYDCDATDGSWIRDRYGYAGDCLVDVAYESFEGGSFIRGSSAYTCDAHGHVEEEATRQTEEGAGGDFHQMAYRQVFENEHEGELLVRADWEHTWDGERDPSFAGWRTWTWDERERLTAFEQDVDGPWVGLKASAYAYDDDDHLIGRADVLHGDAIEARTTSWTWEAGPAGGEGRMIAWEEDDEDDGTVDARGAYTYAGDEPWYAREEVDADADGVVDAVESWTYSCP